MILSRTSQYAIQALVHLAIQPRGVPVLAHDIARRLNVPAAYLSKIMQSLCKGGFLYSQRGRHGGFYLEEGKETVAMMEVLVYIDGDDFTRDCVLGLKVCSDETACPMHCEWKPIKQTIIDLLRECTFKKLAEDVRSGRYRLADLPLATIAQALPHGMREKLYGED